jgi:DNA-binding NarL/FixJ family response regulator
MAVRVLVVDDDSLFRESIARALSDRSYDVIGEARSAAEARDGVSRLRPDAILLDVNLPDGDGISLARELVSGDGGLRVLLTSSDSAAAPGRLVRRSGATGFVAKDELLAGDLSRYLG